MNIQQYDEFEYLDNNFYAFTQNNNLYIENNNIIYLVMFLNGDFRALRLEPSIEEGIQKYFIDGNGGGFYETDVIHDKVNSIIYIGITPDPYDDETGFYDDEDMTLLEAFQKDIVESLHLPTKNFFYILRTWDKYRKEKPLFLLLYQDDKNWFDLKPFETRELMQEFIRAHLKQEEI